MPDVLSAPSSTGELLEGLPTALLSNSATGESITNHEIYGTRQSATAWRNDPPKDKRGAALKCRLAPRD